MTTTDNQAATITLTSARGPIVTPDTEWARGEVDWVLRWLVTVRLPLSVTVRGNLTTIR